MDGRLQRLSAIGDQLEAFSTVVDFEIFRPELDAALGYGDGARGGRPPFDPVMMFKILVIQAPIPVFGCKSHAGIDRRHGFIRKWDVTDAGRHDGRMLRRGLLDKSNTGSTVWADGACRSKSNEAFMAKHGFRSQVHQRKPKGRPMAPHIRRGDASRSKVRAAVEHVFAQQKGAMALFVRTIGLARARTKIGMVNIVRNISRLVRQERRRSFA